MPDGGRKHPLRRLFLRLVFVNDASVRVLDSWASGKTLALQPPCKYFKHGNRRQPVQLAQHLCMQ